MGNECLCIHVDAVPDVSSLQEAGRGRQNTWAACHGLQSVLPKSDSGHVKEEGKHLGEERLLPTMGKVRAQTGSLGSV